MSMMMMTEFQVVSEGVELEKILQTHVCVMTPSGDAAWLAKACSCDDLAYDGKRWLKWDPRMRRWTSFDHRKNRLAAESCSLPYRRLYGLCKSRGDTAMMSSIKDHVRTLYSLSYQDRVLAIAGQNYFGWRGSSNLVLPLDDGTVIAHEGQKLVRRPSQPSDQLTASMPSIPRPSKERQVSIRWVNAFDPEQRKVLQRALGRAVFGNSDSKKLILCGFPEAVAIDLVSFLHCLLGREYCTDDAHDRRTKHTRISITHHEKEEEEEEGCFNMVIAGGVSDDRPSSFVTITHAPLSSQAEESSYATVSELEGFMWLIHGRTARPE